MATTRKAKRARSTPRPQDRKVPGLNPRQERFVAEYLVDLNATQACIRAGYSARTSEQQGPRLLGHVGVRAAIDGALAKRSKRTEISADRVLQEIARVAMLDPRKLYNADGSLKLPHELDDEAAAALASLEVVEEYRGRGRQRRVAGFTRKVRFWNKVEALALLAKHLGLTPDRSFNVDLTHLNDDQLRRLAEGEDVLAVLAAQGAGGTAAP